VLENHVRAELSLKTDYGDIRANRARVSIPVVSFSADESALCRPPPFGSFVRCREREREREREIHPFGDRAILVPSSRGRLLRSVVTFAVRWPFGDLQERMGDTGRLYGTIVKLVLSGYSKIAKNKPRIIKHHYILPYSVRSLFTRAYAGVKRGYTVCRFIMTNRTKNGKV